MVRRTRSRFHIGLSLITCVLVLVLSNAASFSQTLLPSVSSTSMMAGNMMPPMTKRYSIPLSNSNVVPNAPSSTTAMGMAQATLKGDRLMVQGRFSNLSSSLRDYVADPVNPPNPKITSAVHIHRGEASENGPFQFALTVMGNNTGMSGTFKGEYTLSSDQIQALADGKLYIDLHTKQNRAGELRGYFQPA